MNHFAALSAETDPASYYQRFAAEVGLRDWAIANGRHVQLKLLVAEVMRSRTAQRILDIGCGSGVMSSYLTKFGHVTGIDFSAPAIDIARLMVPAGDFRVGTVADLEHGETFDLITLFDVLEHIPRTDRSDFLATVFKLLSPGGMIVASTPHPGHIRWLREFHPELLQIVDEEVEPAHLIEVAGRHQLEMVGYTTYALTQPRQYQVFTFAAAARQGDPAHLTPALHRRLRMIANPITRPLHREVIALIARLRGNRQLARELRRQ
ncbi:unannotated protein [freshwater metagenome]|uniref:Unannotated protein n=1 Tax=freshwater metagenome TaxID=449393 RepID=A0A6J7D8D8_9ZZZZ